MTFELPWQALSKLGPSKRFAWQRNTLWGQSSMSWTPCIQPLFWWNPGQKENWYQDKIINPTLTQLLKWSSHGLSFTYFFTFKNKTKIAFWNVYLNMKYLEWNLPLIESDHYAREDGRICARQEKFWITEENAEPQFFVNFFLAIIIHCNSEWGIS